MDRKLSTGGGSPSGKRKKREAEKRTSPLTPLREKGKGKEQDRVSCETCFSKTARAHVRKRRFPCTCSYAEAGDAAYEIIGSCFGNMGDLDLWAWYCRHFDRNAIVEKAHEYASMQRQGEVLDAITAFQSWLRKEFGANPPSPKASAAALRAMADKSARQGGAA